MVGRHTGKRFTIGTPMRVKLLAASDTTGQIDFAPADGSLRFRKSWIVRAVRDTDRAPRGNRVSAAVTAARDAAANRQGQKPPTRKRR